MSNSSDSYLVELIKDHALIYGDFTLKSGKKSPFYVDMRRLTLCKSGLHNVIFEIRQVLKIQKIHCDGVAGPSAGADPIIAGMVLDGQGHYGFMIRSQAKDHGTEKMVEGQTDKLPGMNVVVVEDVTTSGQSVMKAVKEIEKLGGEIVAVVTVLDRLQGAQNLFQTAVRPDGTVGYPFFALTTIEDFNVHSY